MKKYFSFLLISYFLIVSCKTETSYNDTIEQSVENQKHQKKEVQSSLIKKKSDIAESKDVVQEANNLVGNDSTILDDGAMIMDKNEKMETDVYETVSSKPKKKNSRVKQRGVITFDKMVYDFGSIEEGEIINHDFHFTNTGKGVLEVKGATATCGCTTPSYPFIPINPGERGYIGVTYNSVGKFGQQTPVITVNNNSLEKLIKLKLTGKVVAKSKNLE